MIETRMDIDWFLYHIALQGGLNTLWNAIYPHKMRLVAVYQELISPINMNNAVSPPEFDVRYSEWDYFGM
jgi:hypothetical protein